MKETSNCNVEQKNYCNIVLKCPVCNNRLVRQDKEYRCENKHNYDISSKGYVNLLLANQKKTSDPGDNKEMMKSRREFLDKGYYEKLSKGINETILSCISKSPVNILDCGCGEGYFLCNLKKYLKSNGKVADYYGIDISKSAVTYGAKRDKSINFIVGSNFNIPIMDGSIDVIIRNFAPGDIDEFYRVLNKQGKLVIITPGPDHLYELKEILYKSARKNEEKDNVVEGFKLLSRKEVKYTSHIKGYEDVRNLISMTPYSWTFDYAMKGTADKTDELNTKLDFIISVYEKK